MLRWYNKDTCLKDILEHNSLMAWACVVKGSSWRFHPRLKSRGLSTSKTEVRGQKLACANNRSNFNGRLVICNPENRSTLGGSLLYIILVISFPTGMDIFGDLNKKPLKLDQLSWPATMHNLINKPCQLIDHKYIE